MQHKEALIIFFACLGMCFLILIYIYRVASKFLRGDYFDGASEQGDDVEADMFSETETEKSDLTEKTEPSSERVEAWVTASAKGEPIRDGGVLALTSAIQVTLVYNNEAQTVAGKIHVTERWLPDARPEFLRFRLKILPAGKPKTKTTWQPWNEAKISFPFCLDHRNETKNGVGPDNSSCISVCLYGRNKGYFGKVKILAKSCMTS